jgi:glycosyltransferase involved in cell wall biosynthesis
MPERQNAAALPLVSVIVTNYNYGRYLRQAIDSALTQTYDAVEVVVVDDGSTDDSPAIIRSYGARIRPVLKANGGQASAFNAGVAASRGSLIAFLDADDVFMPTKIARCVEAAMEHRGADLIYHQLQTVDASGALAGRVYPPLLHRGRIAERVRRGGGAWMYAPTSGQVYRRTFLDWIMPVPEAEYQISADAYVAGLAGLLGEVFGFDAILASYRVHGSNGYTYVAGTDERQKLAEHNRRYEIESQALNAALERLGGPWRVQLTDNFVYQLNRLKLRDGSFARVAWLTVRDPGELWVRLKSVVRNAPALCRVAGSRAVQWGAAR